MKLTTTAALAAIMLSAALPAASQERGFYLGVSGGRSEAKGVCDNSTDLGASISCEEKDSAFRGFTGYRLNRHVAVELGYADLGEATAGVVASGVLANARVAATAWDLVAIGSFALTGRIAAFTKLGVYRAETELGGGGSSLAPGSPGGTAPVSFQDEETNTGVTFALGLQYDLTRHFGLRAEWQRYRKVGGGDIGEADVDVGSLGALYTF